MLSIIVRLLGYLQKVRFLSVRSSGAGIKIGDVSVFSLKDYSDYQAYSNNAPKYEGCADLQKVESQAQSRLPVFITRGLCSVCGAPRNFYTDYRYSSSVSGVNVPNWRERMICLRCLLNSRQRASFHLLNQLCNPVPGAKIYITEQHTAYFLMLKSLFPLTVGSEFFGDELPFGATNRSDIRNEDLCDLTFEDSSFDVVLTYDVLEHIPDYKEALAEMYRVLCPEGYVMISVPFDLASSENIVRATINDDGIVRHILEPEYHGNPINRKGCLCFYHFGWELLDDLKAVGFREPRVGLYWSQKFGYFGGEQIIIYAKK